MILLIDIADNKAEGFMDMIKNQSGIKASSISAKDAELFEEIKEINKALKNANLIKAGKLKGRPVEDFLNEL